MPRTGDAIGTKQRHGQQSAKTGADDDIKHGRCRIALDVRDLDRLSLRCSDADRGFADVHLTIPDLSDDSVVHSIRSAQPEFLGVLVKYVDRAGLGPRELGRLCNDGGQHGLQVDRRVDRLGDVAERAQFLDRLRQLGGPLIDLLLEPVGSLRALG